VPRFESVPVAGFPSHPDVGGSLATLITKKTEFPDGSQYNECGKFET